MADDFDRAVAELDVETPDLLEAFDYNQPSIHVQGECHLNAGLPVG